MSLCVPAGIRGLSLLPSLIFSFPFSFCLLFQECDSMMTLALASQTCWCVAFSFLLSSVYFKGTLFAILYSYCTYIFFTKKALKMGKWNGWYNTQTAQPIRSSYHPASIGLGSGISIQFKKKKKKIVWVKPTQSKMNYKFTNFDLNQKRK